MFYPTLADDYKEFGVSYSTLPNMEEALATIAAREIGIRFPLCFVRPLARIQVPAYVQATCALKKI